MFEQYDHLILGNTVQPPGGDAAVVRVLDGPKGLAMTCDVTPRYCEADPFEGGKQAVAEAWRNITAVGGEPLAVTDNLNFGNPERAEIMGQLVGCLEGIGDACRVAGLPDRLGQCLALQRDQRARRSCRPRRSAASASCPTSRGPSASRYGAGDAVILLGETTGWLGQSTFLAEIAGREDGRAAARRSRGRRSATATSCGA